MRLGVLALQGAVEPHLQKFHSLQAQAVEVRTPDELRQVSGLVLPGGESTTMLKLIHLNALWEPLVEFSRSRPCWGVCAGAILLARDVESPKQESLAALDIGVVRNAYGRQINSFVGPVAATAAWPGSQSIEGIFIRAPRINRVGELVTPLLMIDNEPVMVEERNVMASTFHPELGSSSEIHEYFLKKVRAYLG